MDCKKFGQDTEIIKHTIKELIGICERSMFNNYMSCTRATWFRQVERKAEVIEKAKEIIKED